MADVWLLEGHVVGMDLPLPEVIEKRWRDGKLRRVTETGEPWPGGDEYDIIAAPPGDNDPEPPPPDNGSINAGAAAPPGPERPRGNAPRAAWARYATQLSACTEAEAATLTRAELIDIVTAPEDKPAPALT